MAARGQAQRVAREGGTADGERASERHARQRGEQAQVRPTGGAHGGRGESSTAAGAVTAQAQHSAAATKGGNSCRCRLRAGPAMRLRAASPERRGAHARRSARGSAAQRRGRCGHADGAWRSLTQALTARRGPDGAGACERRMARGPCTAAESAWCGKRQADAPQRRGAAAAPAPAPSLTPLSCAVAAQAPRPHRSTPARRAAAECGAAAAARVSGETGRARRLCRPCAAGTRACPWRQIRMPIAPSCVEVPRASRCRCLPPLRSAVGSAARHTQT
jgi:hypothetical protein